MNLRRRTGAAWLAVILGMVASAAPASAEWEALAFGRTFAEPVAYPRWPRFAASWQEHGGDPFLDSVAAVALGGSFALLRDRPSDPAHIPAWEFGIKTGVFAAYEPLAESQDLFNADWLFGTYVSARRGRWSGIARLWHQSSHLGDEFLLNHAVTRVNFVSQTLGGLVAYEPTGWSRLYAGGGWIFDEIPTHYGNWQLQYGLELRSTRQFLHARPFVALDIQHLEGTDWQADVSITGGLEFQNRRLGGPVLRTVVEFYNGRNLNGQFWEDRTRYVGLGVQLTL